jgi:hypothetical protein
VHRSCLSLDKSRLKGDGVCPKPKGKFSYSPLVASSLVTINGPVTLSGEYGPRRLRASRRLVMVGASREPPAPASNAQRWS